MQAPPVKQVARQHNLCVLQPERARDPAFIEQLRALTPDIIAVAAYGQILPREILDLPRLGCVNVHTSLLPKYRGASPIQAAIINGDPETGVTIMKMDVGMDTGDILAQEKTPISPHDTAETLHDRLAAMGADLLVRTIREYAAGRVTPKPQPTEVSLARKIRRGWAYRLAACKESGTVRGFAPWPGVCLSAGTEALKSESEVADGRYSGKPGEILKLENRNCCLRRGCSLRIVTVQREGGKRMAVHDFLAGHPVQPGLVV
jgi:methionyl-tRNA formyltransferase